jgi:hypothetical protein
MPARTRGDRVLQEAAREEVMKSRTYEELAEDYKRVMAERDQAVETVKALQADIQRLHKIMSEKRQ